MLQRASCSRRPDCCAVYTTRTDSLYDVLYVVSSIVSVHKVALEPGTHCRQSWIQVESQQSQPCCFRPIHSGDKVDRVGNNVNRKKLLNSSCCRFVTKTGNKVDRIRRQSTLLPICRQFRRQSTLSPVCTGLNGLHSASAASGLQPIAACLMHISAKNSTLMLSACIQHGYRLINSSGMQ